MSAAAASSSSGNHRYPEVSQLIDMVENIVNEENNEKLISAIQHIHDQAFKVFNLYEKGDLLRELGAVFYQRRGAPATIALNPESNPFIFEMKRCIARIERLSELICARKPCCLEKVGLKNYILAVFHNVDPRNSNTSFEKEQQNAVISHLGNFAVAGARDLIVTKGINVNNKYTRRVHLVDFVYGRQKTGKLEKKLRNASVHLLSRVGYHFTPQNDQSLNLLRQSFNDINFTRNDLQQLVHYGLDINRFAIRVTGLAKEVPLLLHKAIWCKRLDLTRSLVLCGAHVTRDQIPALSAIDWTIANHVAETLENAIQLRDSVLNQQYFNPAFPIVLRQLVLSYYDWRNDCNDEVILHTLRHDDPTFEWHDDGVEDLEPSAAVSDVEVPEGSEDSDNSVAIAAVSKKKKEIPIVAPAERHKKAKNDTTIKAVEKP